MPKNVIVLCSQTLMYEYEVEVPDGVDVEDYVYSFRLNCDELGENGVPLTTITEWGDIIIGDILEEEEGE